MTKFKITKSYIRKCVEDLDSDKGLYWQESCPVSSKLGDGWIVTGTEAVHSKLGRHDLPDRIINWIDEFDDAYLEGKTDKLKGIAFELDFI